MEKKINLLEGPIFSSLMKLALPIMGTSLIQMAYNLTDMIWIGRIGANAVAAVGSAGMYMWLSNGISTLAKMGGQVRVGQSIGSQNKKDAAQYASATIQLGIIFGVIYGMITLLFHSQMIGFFHLTSPDVIKDAEIYLIITCGFVVINFVNQIFTSLMTAIGNSHHPFVATAIGLVINIVLDPLLIFGLHMGVMGAAIATVIAQAIVLILMLYYAKKDKILFDEMRVMQKNTSSIFMKIIKIGFPTGIQSMCFTFISMVIARFIAGYGDVAIAVQKVGSQIESISWMSAEGFGNALNAFVAQNYGAGKSERIKQGFHVSVGFMFGWGVFTTFLLFFFPQAIFHIFLNDEQVLPLGVDYLRILAISQAFMCLEYAAAGCFNGLGKTLPPSFVSVTLTAIRIPLAYVFSQFIGLNGIWWAITVSSILKGIVLFLWFVIKAKNPAYLKKPVEA